MPGIDASGGIGGANGANGLPDLLKPDGREAGPVKNAFDEAMNQAINEITRIQQSAEGAIKNLANGGDMTQAIIEMQKANLNFQLMIEVRNRILSAYDQIMGMQI